MGESMPWVRSITMRCGCVLDIDPSAGECTPCEQHKEEARLERLDEAYDEMRNVFVEPIRKQGEVLRKQGFTEKEVYDTISRAIEFLLTSE